VSITRVGDNRRRYREGWKAGWLVDRRLVRLPFQILNTASFSSSFGVGGATVIDFI
jgi:hypothetical protein